MTQALDHAGRNRPAQMDDTVLWRGQPDTTIRHHQSNKKDILIGLIFVVFGVIILTRSYQDGEAGAVIGALLIPAGVVKAFGWVVGPLIFKDRTSYYVTRSRACIEYRTLLGNLRTSCIRMSKRTDIEIQDGEPPGIKLCCTDGETIVFKDIYEAHHVLVELRRIQRDVL